MINHTGYSEVTIRQMFEGIEAVDTWQTIQKIAKGWSADEKYLIENEGHEKWLLRLSKKESYAAKAKEYAVIGKYATLGFEMSKPLSFGYCNQGQLVYMLLTWVEGESLEEVLPMLSEGEQYRLGREAGAILKKIHRIMPEDAEGAIGRCIEKKKAQMMRYSDSSVRVPKDEVALRYFEMHIGCVASQEAVYQHGDFHPGNLILTPAGKIGVIDFNRWDLGDPFEEFYKLESFGVEVSIPYCMGQIDAYFEDTIPERFWEIQAVYVAHAALYSIKWAESFGQEEIEGMVKRCEATFRHYDYFRRSIPSWYTIK